MPYKSRIKTVEESIRMLDNQITINFGDEI
jgi:hypothetical protein